MNDTTTGSIIRSIRQEKGLTQQQLADILRVSDKTISKWERDQGLPDVSLVEALSRALEVDMSGMLRGQLDVNDNDGGNMKRLKFYLCPTCGNILTSTGNADLACCGRTLEALEEQPCDESHTLTIEAIEEDFYITFPHEMTKQHYLVFIAYVSYDRMILVRLYPEQGSEVRFPRMHGGKFYFACNQHGLRTQTH